MKLARVALLMTVACAAAGHRAKDQVVGASPGLSASAGAPKQEVLLRMVRTGCLGWCPEYTVEVDADGAVRYEGIGYVLTGGSATGRLTAASMATLRQAIDQAKFWSLPIKCCDCYDVTDSPSVKMTVTDARSAKTIDDYHGCNATPKAMRDLEDSVDRIVDIEQWIGTDAQR